MNRQQITFCLLLSAVLMLSLGEVSSAQGQRSYGGWKSSSKASNSNGQSSASQKRMYQTANLSDVELPDIGGFSAGASSSLSSGGGGLPPTTLPAISPANLPATLPGDPSAGMPAFPSSSGAPSSNVFPNDAPASTPSINSPAPSIDNRPAVAAAEQPSYGAENYSLSDPYSNSPVGAPASNPNLSSNTLPPSSGSLSAAPAPQSYTNQNPGYANPNPNYSQPRNDYPNGSQPNSGRSQLGSQMGNGVTTAASTQILPPDINRQPYQPNQELGSNQLRSARDRQSGNELRQGSAGAAQLQPARQPPVHTGLPFVTDRPRRGTYPTSTYNPALFQMAAYQRAANANARTGTQGQLVSQSQPLTAQNQALTARTGVAPGTTPQQGFYPTAYVSCDAPTPSFPATGAVNGTYAPPTYGANVNPGLYTPNNAGFTPLLSLGQENYNVQLGRGLIGQPTVYVPGQPIRNFLRYLSP